MQNYSYAASQRHQRVERIIKRLESFELNHKNIILLMLSIFVAYVIVTREGIVPFVSSFGNLGYIGAFGAGILFSYGFTTVPAASTLFILAKSLSPFLLASIAAVGAMLGDLLIFRFVRDRLAPEIKHIISNDLHLQIPSTRKIMMSSKLRKIIPALAGLIMSVPLPGEFAMILLGAVRYDTKRVLILSFAFNFVGILLLALFGATF